MTHAIELWAMSLNIKALTYEPRLPVKFDFSKIWSKLNGQQLPHKKSPTLQAIPGIRFPRDRVMLKYGVQTLGISRKWNKLVWPWTWSQHLRKRNVAIFNINTQMNEWHKTLIIFREIQLQKMNMLLDRRKKYLKTYGFGRHVRVFFLLAS